MAVDAENNWDENIKARPESLKKRLERGYEISPCLSLGGITA